MDFALKYAVTEIKKRPMEFFPVLLISLGVFILIFNMIIYYESQRITDISYYRLDFEIKLYAMPDESVEYIKTLSYVKNVRKVDAHILNIGFEPPHNQSADAIYRAFDRLIADINLWQYPHYYRYEEIYMQNGFTASSIESWFRSWFNNPYLDALSYTPMVTPPMLIIIFTGSLAMAAAMILVFNLKLKKNINEYAMLRSLGMTSLNIIKINVFQGIGIMLLCAPFAAGISAAVMKLVCEASHNLYPEIKDNTPLIYALPIRHILVTVFIITIASSIALLLVCKLYNKKTIVELITGTGILEISYVEKSSDRFEKAKDFSYYGRLYGKRTRKADMTTNILYVLMLILPLIFVYGIFYFFNGLYNGYLSPEPKPVYNLSVSYNRQNYIIPETIIDEIRGLDGVTKLLKPSIAFRGYITDKNNNRHDISLTEYGEEIYNKYGFGYGISYELTPDKVLSGNLEDLTESGTAAVFESAGVFLGDEVILQYGEQQIKATVAAVLKEDKVFAAMLYSIVFCGAETLKNLLGPEETVYTSIDIFAQNGREEEIILLIEDIIGADYDYNSIYEQREYSEGIIGTNSYIAIKKRAAADIFICFFFAAQIVFLFVSAVLIISSVNNFNISKRRSEFAVIRALGETRSNIIKTVKSSAVINGIIVAAIAVVVTLFFALATDGTPVKTFYYIWDYYLSSYFVYIFTFAFMICVNLISSLNSAKKTTGDNLITDIRKF